jgi:hypothetical protein
MFSEGKQEYLELLKEQKQPADKVSACKAILRVDGYSL